MCRNDGTLQHTTSIPPLVHPSIALSLYAIITILRTIKPIMPMTATKKTETTKPAKTTKSSVTSKATATTAKTTPVPTGEQFIRVGTTLYKIVNQPSLSGGYIKKRIPWNIETLRQDYGKDYMASVPKYDGFCTVPQHLTDLHDLRTEFQPVQPLSTSDESWTVLHHQERKTIGNITTDF